MPKVDFGKVADNNEFEPLPISKYPCVLEVSNVQKDSSGNVMVDMDGNPAITKSDKGEFWSVRATILDGKHIGRWASDRLYFSEASLKRVKIIFQRAGIIEGDEQHDCTPDELDGTYWWVEIDRHEARTNKDGTPKLRKDGKPITDARVGFAGYTPMTPQEAKRYRESYQSWLAHKNGQAADNGDEGEADGDKVPF